MVYFIFMRANRFTSKDNFTPIWSVPTYNIYSFVLQTLLERSVISRSSISGVRFTSSFRQMENNKKHDLCQWKDIRSWWGCQPNKFEDNRNELVKYLQLWKSSLFYGVWSRSQRRTCDASSFHQRYIFHDIFIIIKKIGSIYHVVPVCLWVLCFTSRSNT